MADEFQLGSGGNWWDTSRKFETGSSAQKSTTLNSVASYGWTNEMVDDKPRTSMDTGTVPGSSMVLQGHDQSSGGGLLVDTNMHMMALGLSSQAMDWNQSIFHGSEKADSSFRSMLQEDLSNSNSNFQQETGTASSQDHWREKIYSASSEDSNVNEYKQTSFPVDSAAAYGLLLSENQPQHSTYENRPMNFPYPTNYGSNSGEWTPSWNRFPQTFLRTTVPPKQPSANVHFTNRTPFWNAPGADDVRPNFFSSLPTPLPTPALDEKPKNTSEVRDLSTTAKKTSTQASNKRLRNETPTPLPAFKVRKEKMGDRITALQQLVSPFGKTDTASVLSEAIDYIKSLHERIGTLSAPYMKSVAPIQPQQNSDKSKVPDQGPRQDLRSRGLCLVPVSCTYPFTHDTAVDFWTPAFSGPFR
ncbi:transcription factor bHLH123-like isoform X2 [Olea europaea subsp. europaea]|uniref:Transcription factor bHLH123-like isoform X2 n=1 Tax=Olea europaea subsp. europaea TaxID=158383 RepID=A0A8S0SLV0_OLEEU|nr:transcription factor bHLH123-like isoform X2 [Olea europaea subsp. europaea]